MNKPILIRPDDKLSKLIRDAAKQERRKLGPMAVILLERYFEMLLGEKEYKDA